MCARRLEAGLGLGFVVEGGDGFDEARDGEGVADAASATDKMKRAALLGERDGELDEDGDAGAVNLRDVVEVDDEFSRALLHELLNEIVEMLAGLADGEAAIDLDEMNARGFPSGDFKRGMQSHGSNP